MSDLIPVPIAQSQLDQFKKQAHILGEEVHTIIGGKVMRGNRALNLYAVACNYASYNAVNIASKGFTISPNVSETLFILQDERLTSMAERIAAYSSDIDHPCALKALTALRDKTNDKYQVIDTKKANASVLSKELGVDSMFTDNTMPANRPYRIPSHLTSHIKRKILEAQSNAKTISKEIHKPKGCYLNVSQFNRSPLSIVDKLPELQKILKDDGPLKYFICDKVITSTYLNNLDNLGAQDDNLLLSVAEDNKAGPRFIERLYTPFDGKCLMTELHDDIVNSFRVNASFKHFDFNEDNILPVLSKLSVGSEVMAIFKISNRMSMGDFEIVIGRIKKAIGEEALITVKFVFSEELTGVYEVDILEFFNNEDNRTHVINLLSPLAKGDLHLTGKYSNDDHIQEIDDGMVKCKNANLSGHLRCLNDDEYFKKEDLVNDECETCIEGKKHLSASEEEGYADNKIKWEEG